jgi:hypothetical protein
MTALKSPAERTAVSPLDQLGGPALDVALRFPPSVQPMVGELLVQLRLKCGSLAQGTIHGGYLVTSPAIWRTVRELSRAEIVDACRRVERTFPAFQLNGTDVQPVHVRIEHLLLEAQR